MSRIYPDVCIKANPSILTKEKQNADYKIINLYHIIVSPILNIHWSPLVTHMLDVSSGAY